MIGDIKSEPRIDITNPKFQEVLSEANRLLITLTVLIKDWDNKYMRCNDFRGYYSAVVALASKFVQIIDSYVDSALSVLLFNCMCPSI